MEHLSTKHEPQAFGNSWPTAPMIVLAPEAHLPYNTPMIGSRQVRMFHVEHLAAFSIQLTKLKIMDEPLEEYDADLWLEETFNHCCRPDTAHEGYDHVIAACSGDAQGRLWLSDKGGRKATQVRFCPFCGFQALEDTAPKKTVQLVPHDIALTEPDKPTAQWTVFETRNYKMDHFQFGRVTILATNGCHAKVLTQHGLQRTVCVENLEDIKGVPLMPKVGKKDDAKAEQEKKKAQKEKEMLDRYMNLDF